MGAELARAQGGCGLPPAARGGAARGPVARLAGLYGRLTTTDVTAHCSAALQRIADDVCKDELRRLSFSLTVADPAAEDCPLVACSCGFSDLTGYSLQEIIGRNCRFLLDRVPADLVDPSARTKARAFCSRVACASIYGEVAGGMKDRLFVQVNATKSGELFRNAFFLQEVELDNHVYIVGLQAGIHEDDTLCEDFGERCQAALGKLDEHMSTLEQVLTSQFWYTGPMRRQ